jgi:pimeloyl-ACP methyl ester carboxylesterase
MIKKIILVIAAGFSALFLTQIRCDMSMEELKTKYAKPNSQFIEVNGMDVHYVDEGSGFPLVLVHGTAASLHTWDGWVNNLSGTFRIIRMDIPAYGMTGPNEGHDYSTDAYIDFMKKFLDKIGIKKCHMAGNSLGGRITWTFACLYPEYVRKIILIDPSGYPRQKDLPFVFRLVKMPVVRSIAWFMSPGFFVRKSLREVYGDDSKITKEIQDRYYHMALREGNREAFVARPLTYKDLTGKLKTLAAPTLIMWGTDDEWIPLKDAHKFKRDIKNSKLILYENVGHIPMEEIPERTAKDAKEFLLYP